MSVNLVNRQRVGDTCSYATPDWLETMYFYLLDIYFFHFLLKILLILGILIIVSTYKTDSLLYCVTFQALLTHDISQSKQYLITDVEISLHLLNLLKWRASNDMVVSHFWKLIYLSYILAELCCKLFVFLLNLLLLSLILLTRMSFVSLDTCVHNYLEQYITSYAMSFYEWHKAYLVFIT